jgi:DNA-binding PucR family transcriptional regulator
VGRASGSPSVSSASDEDIVARLRARSDELEAAVLTRVFAIDDPVETADPAYTDGLRAAVAAALEFGFDAFERGGGHVPPIPAGLLAQARLAALNRVNLDTVLRRYIAGNALLEDLLIEEASAVGTLAPLNLKRLLRIQSSLFDRLVAAVSEEYWREAKAEPLSLDRRRAERVERLLGGELVDAAELAYDFAGWHIGVTARGLDAERLVRGILDALDCRSLLIRRAEEVWGWLGAHRRLDPTSVEAAGLSLGAEHVSLAIGEPGARLGGWRLSHRQARVAMEVAVRRQKRVVQYADVALLSSMLRDDLLVASLRALYLEPLRQERDGGTVARQTLRAYLAAERNVTSAAAALGVNRNTVASRLRVVEEKIGRPLAACSADLEAALELEELEV